MKLIEFKVKVYTPNSILNDTELEMLCKDLDRLDIQQKVYGAIRELIRERISSNFSVDVDVE